MASDDPRNEMAAEFSALASRLTALLDERPLRTMIELSRSDAVTLEGLCRYEARELRRGLTPS